MEDRECSKKEVTSSYRRSNHKCFYITLKEYLEKKGNKFDGESVEERKTEINCKIFTRIAHDVMKVYNLINEFYSE